MRRNKRNLQIVVQSSTLQDTISLFSPLQRPPFLASFIMRRLRLRCACGPHVAVQSDSFHELHVQFALKLIC